MYTGRPSCGFSFIAFIASIFWSICGFSTGRSIEFQYEFSELFSFFMEYPDNSCRVLNLNTDSIHCQIISGTQIQLYTHKSIREPVTL